MLSASQETHKGDRFVGPTKRIGFERMLAFSGGPLSGEGWPALNLHTDRDMARQHGLPDALVSGPQYQAQLISLMVDVFGDRWLSDGSMSCKFIHFVVPDALVTPQVIVTGRAESATDIQFELDIVCEDGSGQPVLVGQAKARIAK